MAAKNKGTILCKTLVGSHMWGLNHAGSDKDYRIVEASPLITLLSPSHTTDRNAHKQHQESDTTYYEARAFLKLLMSGNPTLLEVVYSPFKETIGPAWDNIDFANMIDSQRLVDAHVGYGVSLLRRKQKNLGKALSTAMLTIDQAIEIRTNKRVDPPAFKVDREYHLHLRTQKLDVIASARAAQIVVNKMKELEAVNERVAPFKADRGYADSVSLYWYCYGKQGTAFG